MLTFLFILLILGSIGKVLTGGNTGSQFSAGTAWRVGNLTNLLRRSFFK